jgi:hypothetical protein
MNYLEIKRRLEELERTIEDDETRLDKTIRIKRLVHKYLDSKSEPSSPESTGCGERSRGS